MLKPVWVAQTCGFHVHPYLLWQDFCSCVCRSDPVQEQGWVDKISPTGIL